MLGEPVGQQDRLFYEFNLEDRVPNDNLLRRLDAVLDLNWRPSLLFALMAYRYKCHELGEGQVA